MNPWQNAEFAAVCAAVRNSIECHGPITEERVGSTAKRVIAVLAVDQIIEVSPAAALYVLNMIGDENMPGVEATRRKAMFRLAEFVDADRQQPALAGRDERIRKLTEENERLRDEVAEGRYREDVEREVASLRKQLSGTMKEAAALREEIRKARGSTAEADLVREQEQRRKTNEAVKEAVTRVQLAVEHMRDRTRYWRDLCLELMRADDDGPRPTAYDRFEPQAPRKRPPAPDGF